MYCVARGLRAFWGSCRWVKGVMARGVCSWMEVVLFWTRFTWLKISVGLSLLFKAHLMVPGSTFFVATHSTESRAPIKWQTLTTRLFPACYKCEHCSLQDKELIHGLPTPQHGTYITCAVVNKGYCRPCAAPFSFFYKLGKATTGLTTIKSKTLPEIIFCCKYSNIRRPVFPSTYSSRCINPRTAFPFEHPVDTAPKSSPTPKGCPPSPHNGSTRGGSQTRQQVNPNAMDQAPRSLLRPCLAYTHEVYFAG